VLTPITNQTPQQVRARAGAADLAGLCAQADALDTVASWASGQIPAVAAAAAGAAAPAAPRMPASAAGQPAPRPLDDLVVVTASGGRYGTQCQVRRFLGVGIGVCQDAHDARRFFWS
jgi:hypothetical protein